MTVVIRRLVLPSWAVVLPLLFSFSLVSSGQNGFIENRSYQTLCAEADNVNIPIYYSNAAAYRVTASHPKFYPVAMDIRTPDFDDCDFASRVIWTIGTNDGSDLEFFTNVTQASYDYYALDDPPAGIDQDWTNFPKEINNHTTTNIYIHFTAAESGDANTELTIGADLTVDLVNADGTVQLKVATWDGSGWVDQGSKYFSASALTHVWSIPDFTWIEGVDSNTIHMEVVSTGSTVAAWAVFDAIELWKRGEAGPTDYTLYNDGIVHVQAVYIDFWWRAPQSMTIGVIGGTTNYDAHYLRITRKEPTGSGYNEIFVLYEDGNARIIPFPPVSLPSVPYGASVILGPTIEGDRPFAAIDRLTVDPKDLSIDVEYEGGATAHIEIYVDREHSVVDVTDITYNTETQSLTRLRSMYVYDGKTDIDRVASEEGVFPVMTGWSVLNGSWWRFYHEVPSYHNTYCPDFSIEVMSPSQAFLSREAESFDSGVNCTPVMRANASGGTSVWITAAGGEATFDVYLDRLYPEAGVLLQYSDADGGDNGTNRGNRIDLYVDGVPMGHTYSANTGGSNSFETAATLWVGDLYPGDHTFKLTVGAGTGGMELDRLDVVSQPRVLSATNSILTRQGESVDGGSGYGVTNRSLAVSATSLVMSATGAVANYGLEIPGDVSNVYMRLRHSDLWNPTRLEVSIDGNMVAKTPSMTEGTLYVANDEFLYGTASVVADGWFGDGNCGWETWGGENGTPGMAFYGWIPGDGYFGQEVNVDPQYGSVWTFSMRGLYEPAFTSATETAQLKLEFWVRGEGSARRVAAYNAYPQLTNAPDTWHLVRCTATNSDAEINLIKIVADVDDVNSSGGAIKWDSPRLYQSDGAGWNYFEDAGLLLLGDIASGSHTVTITSAAETLGVEVDEFELLTLSRLNRAPQLVVPDGFSMPVGVSTSFVVQLLEYDPDPVLITVTSAPATSTFVSHEFSWTVDAASAGTTNSVWFLADDQQGDVNSKASSNVVITVPYDSDLDAMSDGWEWTWFTTLVHTAEGDFDGDELNNLGESVAGMNPRDSNSYFVVGGVGESLIATGRTVTVSTEPGRQYTIRYSDAIDSANWLRFGNPDIGVWYETSTVSSTHTFIDDESTNTTDQAPTGGVRFYSIDVTRP